MNLYSSFGNLLENWVGKCEADMEQEILCRMENKLQESSKIFRSESEDSGVEEAPVTPLGSEPPATPTAHRAREEQIEPVHVKLEEALWRNDQASLKRRDRPRSTQSCRLVAQPSFRAMMLSSRLKSGAVGLDSIGEAPLLSSDPPSSPQVIEEGAPLRGLRQDPPETDIQLHSEHYVPNPGLTYLEQVCRLLEEIAKLRVANQELQDENERLQSKSWGSITAGAKECHCTSSGTNEVFRAEDQSSQYSSPVQSEGPENRRPTDKSSQSSFEDKPRRLHFRHRSMSDSRVIVRGLDEPRRQVQEYGSTMDMQNGAEIRREWQDGKGKTDHNDYSTKTRSWRRKTTADEYTHSHLAMSSGGKKTKRITQLFRRKTKTLHITTPV